MRPLPDWNIFFRVVEFANHIINQLFEVVRAGCAKESTAIAIGVDISDGMFLEFVAVGLDPLSRAEQSGFFTVPRTVNDGSLGAPSLLVELAQHASLFEHSSHSGERIVGAVDPAVKVIAANYPLVGIVRPTQSRDDVVHR